MRASLALLAATLAVVTSYNVKPEYACACPYIYMPVCGSDGQTYSNKCILRCKNKESNTNIVVAYPGKCKSPFIEAFTGYCNENWEPVCGTDGKTYGNRCHLAHYTKVTNADIKVAYEGECQADKEAEEKVCGCGWTWSPVCGSDGHTYTNLCQLECTKRRTNANLKIVRAMPCEDQELIQKPSCACPKIYKPVCGSDGKTYSNSCIFKCQKALTPNLMVLHDGKC